MAKKLYLDIGTSLIKALVISSDGQIKNSAIFPNLYSKLLTVMSNSEKIQFTDDIRAKLKEAGIRETGLSASLPESLVFAKTMVFPRMSTPELATAIKWELDQSVPFPPNDIESSWSVFEKNKYMGEDRVGVYVVAVPTKTSELYTQLLDLLGLEVSRLENEIVPMVRAFSVYLDEEPCVILDFGSSGVKMALVDKTMIFGSYYFPVGGQGITGLIADNFGLSYEQAEQYKKTYGILEDQLDGKLHKAVIPVIDNMIAEIRKLLLSFRNDYGETKPTKIYMTGGGSLLPGLASYLSKNMNGMSVSVANFLEGQGLDPNVEQLGPYYSIAYGLSK